MQAQTGQSTVNAQIIRAFTPFTLSAVMVVQLDSRVPRQQGHLVLKLFDRRFAAGYRKQLFIDPWTPQIEAQHQKFISDGGASHFLQKLRTDENFLDREGDTWTAAEDEAYIDHKIQSLYNAEKEVYQRAHKLQGRDIPRLLLDVALSSSSSCSFSPGFRCPGILLEFIPGFSLADMADHAPKDQWQYVGDEAIRILHAIADLGVLNKDVQRRSFIVRWDQHIGRFRPVMIDFNLVVFREEVKSELEWRKRKADQDEEGAIGMVLQRKLYPDFVYRRSEEYEQLSREFRSE